MSILRVSRSKSIKDNINSLNLLSQVTWKHLYSKSSSDHSTLAFFRSWLNRVAVTKDPKKSVDASVELLEAITKGHWLGCACEILGISGLDDTLHLPPSMVTGTASEKYSYIQGLAQKVVDKATIVDSAFFACDMQEEDISDTVYNYSKVLCHYGALAVVSAPLQSSWVYQIFPGRFEASHSAEDAIPKPSPSSEMASICKHQGRTWEEHTL